MSVTTINEYLYYGLSTDLMLSILTEVAMESMPFIISVAIGFGGFGVWNLVLRHQQQETKADLKEHTDTCVTRNETIANTGGAQTEILKRIEEKVDETARHLVDSLKSNMDDHAGFSDRISRVESSVALLADRSTRR